MKKDKQMKRLGAILAAMLALSVHAEGVPYTFSVNTPARAAEVNANFQAILSEIQTLRSEIEAMEALLAYVNSAADDLGHDAVFFDNVNVQLRAGGGNQGSELGNLIIGYYAPALVAICSKHDFLDQVSCEAADGVWATNQRQGTHSLIIGDAHNHTASNALISGTGNHVNAQNATSIAGTSNMVSGKNSLIVGGAFNYATGNNNAIYAGTQNQTKGGRNVIAAGSFNTTNFSHTSISGGYDNKASGDYSNVSAGRNNQAIGDYSNISGGTNNQSKGQYSHIEGGNNNRTSVNAYAGTVSGGENRKVSGEHDWRAGNLFEDN